MVSWLVRGVVIHPVVKACGYEPVLASTEEQPAAINDDIRAHLVFDPMVVVDLGGRNPEDPANPNVMYELGIRHAFGRPLVILAWEGQRLPFDVSNQRAILSRRDFRDMEVTKQKLARFIRAAEEGRFYNPMEAVGREAAIDTTSLVLGEESLLGALAKEIRELRKSLPSRQDARIAPKTSLKIKWTMSKTTKAELWALAQRLGFEPHAWGKLMSTKVSPTQHEVMSAWSNKDWEKYLSDYSVRLPAMQDEYSAEITEEFIQQVNNRLPTQPWPSGIHKKVANDLNVSAKQVTKAIRALILRGDVFDQQNGVLIGSQPTRNIISAQD